MKFTIYLIAILAIELSAQSGQGWQLGPDMSAVRSHTALIKLSDTTALIAGGWSTGSYGDPTNSCDLLIAGNDGLLIQALPPMQNARAEFPAYLMSDTAVIVLGGVTHNGDVLTEVEIFHIRTQKWSHAGFLKVGRRQHVAYPIGGSRFIVVGGRNADLATLSSAEIFDATSGETQIIPDYPDPINGAVGTTTSSGTGIVFGGRDGGANGPRSKYIRTFNPFAQTWDIVDSLSEGREAPISCKLHNGSVVIAGGAFKEEALDLTGEVVLEADDEFRVIANDLEGRLYSAIAEFPQDRIVIAGGQDITSKGVASTQYVNVITGNVTTGPNLIYPRYRTRGVVLKIRKTGRGLVPVLVVVGGTDVNERSLKSIEYLEADCAEQSDLLASPNMIAIAGDVVPTASESIKLTSSKQYSKSAVWYRGKLDLRAGLVTTFSFRLSEGSDSGAPDGGNPGADGIALVVQNDYMYPIGSSGGGIGYDGISNALAVEFDAYLNVQHSDPTGSHVALQSAKNAPIRSTHEDPYLRGMTFNVPSMRSNGTVYHARVVFDELGLRVYLDTAGSFATPVLSIPWSRIDELIQLDSQGAAWIGITSSTGTSVQIHELLSWEVNSCQLITSVQDGGGSDPRADASHAPSVYPMPSRDEAIVRWTNARADVVVHVYDLNGLAVWTHEGTADELRGGIRLPADELTSGFYTIQITDAENVVTLRWLVID